MSDTQTISLNGHRYDALTGRPIKDGESSGKAHHSAIRPRSNRYAERSHSVDGFVSRRGNYKELIRESTQNTVAHTKKQLDHHVAPHVSRLTEHSKTLMRDIVNRPGVTKIKSHHQAAKASLLNQAKNIKESEFVGRLNELTTPASPISADPDALQTTANSEIYLKKLDELSQIESNPEIDEIFNEASLKLSDSHQPTARYTHRFYDKIADKLGISDKLLLIFSVIAFILISGGITSYIYSNNIAMYLADTRTGIHGILPTFKPPEFSLTSISYTTGGSTGSIILNFKDPAAPTRKYSVEERASTWDSQELATSVVMPAVGNNYQTYHIGGRSVFIYNYQQRAVWLDEGIYYTMINSAGLTISQITQIANTT